MHIKNSEGTQVADLPDRLGEMMLRCGWVTISDSDYQEFMDSEATLLPDLGGGKQLYAAGVDPDAAVPQSYIPGMVIGVTASGLKKLVGAGKVPFSLQGNAKMIKPSDVVAALAQDRGQHNN
jgi:hypothetical protein